MIRIFLSFSSKDKYIVRPLMALLREQGLQVWDYSDIRDQIPVGNSISKALKKEIQESHWFIPILSKYSTEKETSQYVREEIAYSVQLGFLEKQKILPLLLKEFPPNKELWEAGHILYPLKYHLFREIEGDSPSELINLVTCICKKIGFNYMPKFPPDPKLPFWEKFEFEVKTLLHSNSVHIELSMIIGEFVHAYSEQNLHRAEFLIGYFLDTVKYRLPEATIYYSYIVHGTIALHLQKPDLAYSRFKMAQSLNPDDSNGHGGLGMVCIARRDYGEAITHFQKVLTLKSEDKFNDICNLATAFIGAGKQLPSEVIGNITAANIETVSERDRNTVRILQAHIQRVNNDPSESLKILSPILVKKTIPFMAILEAVLTYSAKKQPDDIFQLIKKMTDFENVYTSEEIAKIYDLYADTLIAVEKYSAALNVYDQVLSQPKFKNRLYLVKLARLCCYLGKKDLCQKSCKDVINNTIFGLPKTADDFYHAGYAQYLLGNNIKAEYDRERSGYKDLYKA